MPLIRDPVHVPPLHASQGKPGIRVLHRRGQWAATVVCVQWPTLWVQYDADRERGISRATVLSAADVVLLATVERRP